MEQYCVLGDGSGKDHIMGRMDRYELVIRCFGDYVSLLLMASYVTSSILT